MYFLIRGDISNNNVSFVVRSMLQWVWFMHNFFSVDHYIGLCRNFSSSKQFCPFPYSEIVTSHEHTNKASGINWARFLVGLYRFPTRFSKSYSLQDPWVKIRVQFEIWLSTALSRLRSESTATEQHCDHYWYMPWHLDMRNETISRLTCSNKAWRRLALPRQILSLVPSTSLLWELELV